MRDRNNTRSNKTQGADKDQKNKSSADQKSRAPGQPDRDRQSTSGSGHR